MWHKRVVTDSNDDLLNPEPRKSTLVFLIAQMRDENVEDMRDLTARVTDNLLAHDANIVGFRGSCIISIFGAPFFEGDQSRTQCALAVQDLQGMFPHDLKMIYGITQGVRGVFNSFALPSFDPVIPGLSAILKELEQLNYGTAQGMGMQLP